MTNPPQDAVERVERIPYSKRPFGDAGDALDYALDHIEDDERRVDFLECWREDKAAEWPGYMRWLGTQQRCAAESKAERSLTKPDEEMVGSDVFMAMSHGANFKFMELAQENAPQDLLDAQGDLAVLLRDVADKAKEIEAIKAITLAPYEER